LHLISRVDRPIIYHCHPHPFSLLDKFRLALQGPFNGSSEFVGKGKKLAHIIVNISTDNQVVTNSKDIYGMLDSNEHKKLVKSI
jgi:hypothetical protein